MNDGYRGSVKEEGFSGTAEGFLSTGALQAPVLGYEEVDLFPPFLIASLAR